MTDDQVKKAGELLHELVRLHGEQWARDAVDGLEAVVYAHERHEAIVGQ